MNKTILLNALNAYLVGKELPTGCLSYYNIESDITKIVHNQLRIDGVAEDIIKDVSASVYKYDKTYYRIEYKGYYFYGVSIRKKRGKWNKSYGTQYTWTYEPFVGDDADFDFNAKVKEINKAIADDKNRKERLFNELYAVYKKLCRLYGENDAYSLINRLHDKKYELSKRYENDTEKDFKIVVLPKVMSDYARRLDDLHFNIDILTQDIESQKCDWENADNDDMAKDTLKKLKADGITPDMVVKELDQTLDILEDLRDQTKVFQK